MEDKKKLDSSHRSILENSQYLYPDNDNRNNDYQKYQEELQKYEKNNNNNRKNNQYHFQYSGRSSDNNNGSNDNDNNFSFKDNMSNYTFGNNGNNDSRIENNLGKSFQNINQAGLYLENSNFFNSSHLDLSNSITIKKENDLITKTQYVAFANNYGDNSCYVNVVLQLIFNITDLSNIFKDLYQIDELEKQNSKDKSNASTKVNTIVSNANTNVSNKNNNTNISTSSSLNNSKSNINTNPNNNTNLSQSKTFKIPDINELFVEIGEILCDYELYLNKENTVQQVTILDTKKMRTCLERLSNGLFPLNYVADPVELFIFILDNLNLNYKREIHSNFYLELIDKAVCLRRCPNSCKKLFDKDNFLYHIYIEELLNYIKDNAIKFKMTKGDLFHLSYSLYTDEKKECEKCNLLMDKFLLCFSMPKYVLINCVWKNQVPDIKDIVSFLFLLSLEEDLNRLFICQNNGRNNNTMYNFVAMILYSYTLCHYTVLIFNQKEHVFVLYNDDTVKEFKTLYDAFPEMLINNVNLYDNDRAYFYPVMLIYTKDSIYNSADIRNNTLDEKKYLELLNQIELNQEDFVKRHTLSEEQKKKNLDELMEKQRIYEQNMRNKKSNTEVKNNKNNNNDNKNKVNNSNSINNNKNANNNNNNNKEVNWMDYDFEDDKRNNKNNINNNTKNNKNNNTSLTNDDYYKIYGNDILQSKPGMQEYKNYYEELNNLNIDDLVNQKNKKNNTYKNAYLKSIHEQSNANINNSVRTNNKNNLEASQRINLNNNYLNNDDDDDIENENNRLAQTQILPSTKYFNNIKNNNNLNTKKSYNNNNNINNSNNNKKGKEVGQNDIKNQNQRKKENKLSSSQQINLNNQNAYFNDDDQDNLNNNNKNYLSSTQYNIGNNIRQNLGSNQYNSGNNNRNNLAQSQYNVGNNNRINLAQSQYNIGSNNNRTNTYYSQYDIDNKNNRNNLAQSQYNMGNYNRPNMTQIQQNTTNNNLAQSHYNIRSNYRK